MSELSEDTTKVNRLSDRVKEYEETVKKLEGELKGEKERVRVLKQEGDDLKAQLKAKVKEDSNKVTEAAVTSSVKL